MKTFKQIVEKSFIKDLDKMQDFMALTKEDFLKSYSYITEQEYTNTELLDDFLGGRIEYSELLEKAEIKIYKIDKNN